MPELRPTSDGVPAWMSEHGIKKGEWFSMTKAQLKTRQRPDQPLKTQVWATGILHTACYQGQQAYTMRNGKRVPLTPGDIIRELHQIAVDYFQKGGIEATPEQLNDLKETKETIRRALSQLEDDGVAMRTDLKGRPLSELSPAELRRLTHGKTLLFFWLKPRQANPRTVANEWQEHQTAKQIHEVDKNRLHEIPISRILNTFRIGKFSKTQLSDPLFQARIKHAYENARLAFARELEVDISCLLDSVDSRSLPEVDTGRGAFERNTDRKEMQAAGSEVDTTDSLPPAFLGTELSRRKLSAGPSLLSKIMKTLGKCPPSYFIEVLDRRAERGAIGSGLLNHIAEDARKEFDAMCAAVDQEVA